MDQYDLEFKVYGSAEQNRNFGAALLFLEYNSDVFGDSIMTNSKLSVFKAPAFAGNSYSLLSNDDSDNVFGVSLVFTDFANSLGLLLPAGSKIHLYTVNITFSKTGCNNKPEFKPTEWDRVNFITHYMHPIDSSFTNYDTVTIEPIPNPTLCPFPQITTSFKNILGKRAGVGDTLVIKGHNFGQPGYVAFKDANFPSLVYTKGLESQYRLIWTDTLIKVLVPSLIKEGYLGDATGCAGSGLVKVYTMTGDSAISDDTLHIEYAQINIKDGATFHPLYQSKLYCVNGFVFTLDSSMISENDQIEAIEYCLKQWQDFTGMRLELEKNTLGAYIFLNKDSDLQFRNFISNDSWESNDIMITSTYYSLGDNSPDKIFVRRNHANISINKNQSFWLKPTGDKPAGYYDFISTLLHELGHVLNIDHDVQYENDLKSLMYFSSQESFVSATNRENLNQWGTEAKNGVQYVIDQSKIQPLDDYAFIKPLFSGNIPALSSAPIINPSKDTTLCAESVSTYTLTSNNATNNRWNTGATTQSINLSPPSFPTGQTELSRYYSVKQWNENCTLTSNPSMPVKVTWKKYCLKPPGDDKFTDEEINQRSYNQTNPILYPNPFSQGIQCEFEELVEGNLTVYISTINGNQVIKKEIQVKKGNLEYYIPLADLSSGIYFIIIKCGNKISQQQMIKVE
ncbi:MAG: zinc-dependent metalloprotease [Saprospiraceae bacterium]|nr:zinc-dependent metalloprotease [Saprospiraceae bacterium]